MAALHAIPFDYRFNFLNSCFSFRVLVGFWVSACTGVGGGCRWIRAAGKSPDLVLAVPIRPARTVCEFLPVQPVSHSISHATDSSCEILRYQSVLRHSSGTNSYCDILAVPIRPASSHATNSSCKISRYQFVLRDLIEMGIATGIGFMTDSIHNEVQIDA